MTIRKLFLRELQFGHDQVYGRVHYEDNLAFKYIANCQ